MQGGRGRGEGLGNISQMVNIGRLSLLIYPRSFRAYSTGIMRRIATTEHIICNSCPWREDDHLEEHPQCRYYSSQVFIDGSRGSKYAGTPIPFGKYYQPQKISILDSLAQWWGATTRNIPIIGEGEGRDYRDG
jgi:hypothetical protein